MALLRLGRADEAREADLDRPGPPGRDRHNLGGSWSHDLVNRVVLRGEADALVLDAALPTDAFAP